MAYQDLISDVDVNLRVNLNDNFDAQYSNPPLVETITGLTPGYLNDHPYIAGGKSLNLNTSSVKTFYYAPSNDGIAENRYNVVDGYTTKEVWFKYTLGPSNATPSVQFYETRKWTDTNGTIVEEILGLAGNGTYGTANYGKVFFTFKTATASASANYSTSYVTPGVWHVIHIDKKITNNGTTVHMQMYIDGILETTGTTTQTYYSQNRLFRQVTVGGTSGNITGTACMSSLVLYNRYLTKEEKLARYMIANSQGLSENWIIDAENTVQSALPKVYFKFENTDKTTNLPNYGTAGGTSGFTYGANVSVNEPSRTGKGWKFTNGSPAAANTASISSDVIRAAGQKSMLNIDGYSFEFMVYIPERTYNTTTQLHRYFQATGAGSGTHYLPIIFDSGNMITTANAHIGHPDGTIPYVSSTTGAWQTGSLSTFARNQFYDAADNNWHHVVFKFERTTAGLQRGSMYLDGALVRQRTFSSTSTYTWETATTPYIEYAWSPAVFGIASSLTNDGRNHMIDNFAIYDRVLTDTEIVDHYKAMFGPVAPATGVVKYYDGSTWQLATAAKTWNGTAWVDWVKKYWDGTAWVDLP